MGRVVVVDEKVAPPPEGEEKTELQMNEKKGDYIKVEDLTGDQNFDDSSPCLNYDLDTEERGDALRERIDGGLKREEDTKKKNGKQNPGVNSNGKCKLKQEEKEVKKEKREKKREEEVEVVQYELNNSARIYTNDELVSLFSEQVNKCNSNSDFGRIVHNLLNKLETTTNVIREIEVIYEGKKRIREALILFLLHIHPIIYNSAFVKIFPNTNKSTVKFILGDLEKKGFLKRVNDSEFIHEKQVFMSANLNPHAGRYPIQWFSLTEMAKGIFREAPFPDEAEFHDLFSGYKTALRRAHKVLKQRQKRIEAKKREEDEQRRRREQQRKVRIEYLESRFNVAKDFLLRFSIGYFDTGSTKWHEIQTTLITKYGIAQPQPHEVKEIVEVWREEKGDVKNARHNNR